MDHLKASVRTRDVFVEIRGIIPPALLDVLRRAYGTRLIIRVPFGERFRDVMNARLHGAEPLQPRAAACLRYFRRERELTQAKVGDMLGGASRQNVCDMERGRRPIGRTMAVRLGRLFGVSPLKFLR